MAIHLGNVLEQVLRMKRVRISELSRKLKVSRRTIYNWFEQENLNVQVILRVGELIGHDFSEELPETFIRKQRHFLNEEDISFTKDVDMENNSVYFWMNKYISLLEKYNNLLNHISENPSSPNNDLKWKNGRF